MFVLILFDFCHFPSRQTSMW